MLLFLQKIPVPRCAEITVCAACVSGFGMGLSKTLRANGAVMVPSLCSSHGRNLISLLLFTVLVSGPITNTLHNTELVSSSLLCSAELASNQTQKMLEKVFSPLTAVYDSLQEIGNNALETARRIQNLVNTLTDTVHQIARTIKNQLHFLADIGNICNREMLSPYRKCRKLFLDGKENCDNLLGVFDFLCNIVTGFMPLCDLAKIGAVFCVIPSFVAQQLKEHIADPVVAAFERLEEEFAFNLNVSETSALVMNSSQSLQEAAQNILEEVTSELHWLDMFSQPLSYTTLLLLVWAYFSAAHYRHKYLQDLDFDNIYINSAFKELDYDVTSRGGASILPITAQESKIYISPFSYRLSNREKRAVLMGVVSWLRHVVISGILVALDYLIFWVLDQVQHQSTSDIIARAPTMVQVSVNGSGFAADIYRDLVHSFQILQNHNITVFSRACVVHPREPDFDTLVQIGFLLGLFFLLAVCGGFAPRTRKVICSLFYPEREHERLCHLRDKIFEQRVWEKKALRTAFFRKLPFRSREPGRIQGLLVRIPGVSRLLQKLSRKKISCVSCCEIVNPELAEHCATPNCNAVYCGVCLLLWEASCLRCEEPLTSLDDLSDLELGSSDDEDSGSELNLDETSSIQDYDEKEGRITQSLNNKN
ncbi:DC-STAMP domain-containing protein 2 [Eucyclogobius newberryi]|uniref:DC-STAMP domain-containing protein 2 n=1 Tax=Eucyclogobius newberryi TaxID=166745 RepID=UPI003B5C31AC